MVIEELGDGVLRALVGGRDEAATGLQDLKRTMTKQFVTLAARTRFSFLHDVYFTAAAKRLEDDSRVQVLRNRAGDHFIVDDKYAVMVKHHDDERRVRSYSTRAARQYHSGLAMIDGLELITLTAGYLYDEDLNEVGAAVISHGRGLDRTPEWCYEITPEAGSAGIALNPLTTPPLPLIDVEPSERRAEGQA